MAAARPVLGAESKPVSVTPAKEVDFLDARWIEHTYFLTRKLNQPQRFQEEPVIGPSPAATKGTILPKGDGFAMWYTAPHRRGEKGKGPLYRKCVHYAVSQDGHTFEKPALGLRKFELSDEKNIILATDEVDAQGRPLNGNGGGLGFCVLDANLQKVPHARGRYTAMFRANLPQKGDGLCLAWSEDGLHWNAYPENPIPYGADSYSNFLYDEQLGLYVAYVRPRRIHAGPSRVNRLVARIESEDMIHWGNERVVLDADDRDAPAQGKLTSGDESLGYPRGRDIQFYGLTVSRHQDLYLGLASVYDSPKGSMWCELVHSYDGIEWRREVPREPLIPLGAEGSWDCGMVGTVSAGCPLAVGDDWYIYYSGTNWDHHFNIRGMKDKGMLRLIGAVRLKRGRLVGYQTGPAGSAGQESASGSRIPADWQNRGELLTRPFKMENARLFLNADAASGSVVVSVLGRDGKVVPGFSSKDAVPVEGDSLRSEILFRNGQSIAQLRGQEIRLRMLLANASVYGLAFAP